MRMAVLMKMRPMQRKKNKYCLLFFVIVLFVLYDLLHGIESHFLCLSFCVCLFV